MSLSVVKKFDPTIAAQRTFFCIECSSCGTQGLVNKTRMKTSKEGAEERFVISSLRRSGWHLESNLKKPLCPACVAEQERKRAESKARVKELRSREMVQSTPKPEPPKVEPPNAEPLKADPPPQPKPSDNRRIIQALDDAYDLQAGCYSRGYSDEKVANDLRVPLAWVREMRSKLYGEALHPEVTALLPSLTALENRAAEHGRAVQRMAQEHSALTEAISAMKARIQSIKGV